MADFLVATASTEIRDFKIDVTAAGYKERYQIRPLKESTIPGCLPSCYYWCIFYAIRAQRIRRKSSWTN
jgi:hypothetical protein